MMLVCTAGNLNLKYGLFTPPPEICFLPSGLPQVPRRPKSLVDRIRRHNHGSPRFFLQSASNRAPDGDGVSLANRRCARVLVFVKNASALVPLKIAPVSLVLAL